MQSPFSAGARLLAGSDGWAGRDVCWFAGAPVRCGTEIHRVRPNACFGPKEVSCSRRTQIKERRALLSVSQGNSAARPEHEAAGPWGARDARHCRLPGKLPKTQEI